MQEPVGNRSEASGRKPSLDGDRTHCFLSLVRRVERAWPLSMVLVLTAIIGLWLLS